MDRIFRISGSKKTRGLSHALTMTSAGTSVRLRRVLAKIRVQIYVRRHFLISALLILHWNSANSEAKFHSVENDGVFKWLVRGRI